MALGKLTTEVAELREQQKSEIANSLCLNLQSPQGWDYAPIGMITAQSTMGTGFLSEMSSDWNDFFGLESKTMNSKILKGEDNCLKILKSKCLMLGGNAVIGIDVDYSELGGGRNMIMVCMTGTAVRVKNTEVFPEENRNRIARMADLEEQMKRFSQFSSIIEYHIHS